MDQLSFIDKLDDEQLDNFNKIVDKAIVIGIDPRLAVSLAFNESGLRQNKVGDAGEIGIMQIKPSTAKLIGFDEKQIKSLDSNIDAGLTYLKQNIDRFKDPVLGAMAYNTGPDHPFFHGKGEPSEQGLSYVNKIQALGGFVPTPTQDTEETTADNKGGKPPPPPASEEDYRALKAAGLGAAAGTAIGTAEKGAMAILDRLGNKVAPAAPGGATSGEKWSANWAGQERPGVKSVPEAAAAYQRSKGQGPVTSEITKKFGPSAPPQPGVFTGGRLAGMAPPTPAPTTGQAIKSGLQTVGNVMARSPVVTGALAGAGAGYSAQEAMDRRSKGDTAGMAIAGLGAAGNVASMIPTLPTRIIGGGLAMASPAALVLLDRMRKATPEQTQRMLTNVDPMGNPLP